MALNRLGNSVGRPPSSLAVLTASALERFWKYVTSTPIDGCWLWNGATSRNGYGKFCVCRELVCASRYSYKIHKGPLGDLCVCHTCDTPACVNPDHLFLGTCRDNAQDMVAKGRHVSGDVAGERNPNCTLTWADVRYIRAQKAAGMRTVTLAETFSVSSSLIVQIARGTIWKEHTDGIN